MFRSRYTVLIGVSALLAGCAVEHGTIDHPNPLFDLHLGPVAFIAFPSSTVLHIGSTYLTLSLPFYFPLALFVALALLFVLLSRRRHAQER